MTKHADSSVPSVTAEPESMDELRGDCARMAPHWASAARSAPAEHVSPSRIQGVTVPPASAHLLDGMSEYGD
ncbi:hypothetical protein [Streptomyces sp. NPDC047108]|uniref:hypothetical protein n=1 Tax=Streptomyces sp. NPDC047108 TaxID=3155025 RepID=UPI0033CE1EBA